MKIKGKSINRCFEKGNSFEENISNAIIKLEIIKTECSSTTKCESAFPNLNLRFKL